VDNQERIGRPQGKRQYNLSKIKGYVEIVDRDGWNDMGMEQFAGLYNFFMKFAKNRVDMEWGDMKAAYRIFEALAAQGANGGKYCPQMPYRPVKWFESADDGFPGVAFNSH
jgi:hypothetical protein